MCGIAGFISPYDSLVQPQKVQLMIDKLRHRGPDGEGLWTNENQTVCLGHRRLAIIDTSDAAAQPFHYNQYTLVYNGEIYNYIELKETLKKHGIESRMLWKPMHLQPVFKGTEVITSHLETELFQWGVCLPSGSNLENDDIFNIIDAISKTDLSLIS